MLNKTDKILIVVESPNKVATIKDIIKKAGYKNAQVMASVGHVMELANDYKSYKNTGVYTNKNFDLNLKVADEKYQVVEKLKAAAAAVDYVFLATDGDREGEVISWSLVKFLKLPKSKCFRMITHEITPKAVVKALENPVKFDDALVEAGLTRLALDKMIGYSLSPVAKTYVGARSVGRCQSVGLKLVCDREREIRDFKPEKYFDLYLKFIKNNTEFKAKYIGTRTASVEHLASEAQIDTIKRNCKGDYIIAGIDQKIKQESPKPPFTTATFQQEVASKLGLGVKDAMSIAQKLFEGLDIHGEHHALITYMRTDDDTMSEEFINEQLKPYIEAKYGKKAYNKPRQGKKADNAQEGHECLRVTDINFTPEDAKDLLNDLHYKVYKIIWQRTVAACLPNAEISETGYLIDNSGELFLLVSKEVVNEGYRKVYSYKDDESDDDEGLVKETFVKGEKLQDTKLEVEAKETKPKPRFSEASLVKELQKREIGRPSTYATIVETVLSETRGYAKIEDKKIVPTERGLQLAAFLDRAFPELINLEYSKKLEESLDKIATGKQTKLQFLNDFYNTLEDSIKSNDEVAVGSAEAKTCPKCGAPMIMRRSRFGKLFYGCSNYPKCNGIVNAV